MSYKWIENVEKLPDNSVLKYIKGIERRLESEENVQTRAVLGERLGVLIVEAETRKLEIKEG